MGHLVGKQTMWPPNRSDTNQPAQAQKRARSLKFRIKVEEELYYGAGNREADPRLCLHLCRLLALPRGGSYGFHNSGMVPDISLRKHVHAIYIGFCPM